MPRITRKRTLTRTSRKVVLDEPFLVQTPALPATEPVPVAVLPKTQALWRRPAVLGQVTLLLMMMGIAGYYYYQYRQTPEVAQRREIESLVKSVGNIADLPQDEIPTLATVTNKSKLDSQPFFRRAENGDKILIYRSVSRAFLYRPNTKKLIDITSVNIEMDAPVQTADASAASLPVETPEVSSSPQTADASTSDQLEATAEVPPTVAGVSTEEEEPKQENVIEAKPIQILLYNGSATVGVTNRVEERIREKFPSVNVIGKEKASKNTYQGYEVIDLTGNNVEVAKVLVDFLGGTLSTLSADENIGVVEADILIIVGNGVK